MAGFTPTIAPTRSVHKNRPKTPQAWGGGVRFLGRWLFVQALNSLRVLWWQSGTRCGIGSWFAGMIQGLI
ncbi:hypothetical protein GZ77_07115 [Endozoicomonas montiporae]|uniref:Uncharacterized protein n=1 Tax=Endozoicomonas montiporae TaxID=1027273 RepID=A0A081N6X2_9GAMM|nr:hypothetical protein GZ77_07115 [Endozoicomonas montiporae]